MIKSLDVIATAGTWLGTGPVDIRRLSEGLCRDCGVDASGLSPLDFADAVQERDSSHWRELGFACAACLASYLASNECSHEEFLQGVAVICILSNAIRRGHGDLHFVLDHVLEFLARNMTLADAETRADILRLLLSPPGWANSSG